MEGEASQYKRLLNRELLSDPHDGVNYFKRFLRPHFIKGAQTVFLYRFMQFMKYHRGTMDLQKWMTRFQLTGNRLIESWMDLLPDLLTTSRASSLEKGRATAHGTTGHRDTGTTGQRDTGPTGQRDNGTPGQRDNGTTGHRANGTTGQRDNGPTGGDNGTPGQRDNGTPGQRDNRTTGHRANGTTGQRDTGPTGHRANGTPGQRDTARANGDNGTTGQRDNGPTGRRETGKPTGRGNGTMTKSRKNSKGNTHGINKRASQATKLDDGWPGSVEEHVTLF